MASAGRIGKCSAMSCFIPPGPAPLPIHSAGNVKCRFLSRCRGELNAAVGDLSLGGQQLHYSQYCKLIMCEKNNVGREFSGGAPEVSEFLLMRLIFSSMKRCSGCWIHFSYSRFSVRGQTWFLYESRDGFIGTFFFVNLLWGNFGAIYNAFSTGTQPTFLLSTAPH